MSNKLVKKADDDKVVSFKKERFQRKVGKRFEKASSFLDKHPLLKAYLTAFVLNTIFSLFAFNISMMIPYTVSYIPYIAMIVLSFIIAICVSDVMRHKIVCFLLMPFLYLNIYMLIWFINISMLDKGMLVN